MNNQTPGTKILYKALNEVKLQLDHLREAMEFPALLANINQDYPTCAPIKDQVHLNQLVMVELPELERQYNLIYAKLNPLPKLQKVRRSWSNKHNKVAATNVIEITPKHPLSTPLPIEGIWTKWVVDKHKVHSREWRAPGRGVLPWDPL